MNELVEIKGKEPNQDTINFLQTLLSKAIAGELLSVAMVCGWDNGSMSRLWVADKGHSKETLAYQANLLNMDFSILSLIEDEHSGLNALINDLTK